ncbi:MAG TPA: hypothetical protein VMY35_12270 [Phycisphaerae bacterium]|nr:hypothetical protein [Phycisphaerae bacterium]
MANTGNSAGRWTRWAVGLVVVILVAVLSSLAAGVLSNGRGVAENRTGIRVIEPRLERIEAKQDRLLEIFMARKEKTNE